MKKIISIALLSVLSTAIFADTGSITITKWNNNKYPLVAQGEVGEGGCTFSSGAVAGANGTVIIKGLVKTQTWWNPGKPCHYNISYLISSYPITQMGKLAGNVVVGTTI